MLYFSIRLSAVQFFFFSMAIFLLALSYSLSYIKPPTFSMEIFINHQLFQTSFFQIINFFKRLFSQIINFFKRLFKNMVHLATAWGGVQNSYDTKMDRQYYYKHNAVTTTIVTCPFAMTFALSTNVFANIIFHHLLQT